MQEIIDLSQEIYSGMPVYRRLPPVHVEPYATHEEWAGEKAPKTQTPAVNRLDMGEHTGTHVDAISHMGKAYAGQSIETMPLSTFYTSGFCLDFSHKGLQALIEPDEIAAACTSCGQEIKKGDTLLFHTDHYRRAFGTPAWGKGPGLSAQSARWLGEQGIAAFGVETMAPGVSGVSNRAVHDICGELNLTHYENLVNLHLLLNRGRFRFIGLPLKIRGGTGSPVRAIAVFEE